MADAKADGRDARLGVMPKLADFHAALAECARLSAHTQATQARIQQAAEDRLSTVNAQIAQLRPQALVDPKIAHAYQQALEERGTLLRILPLAHS